MEFLTGTRCASLASLPLCTFTFTRDLTSVATSTLLLQWCEDLGVAGSALTVAVWTTVTSPLPLAPSRGMFLETHPRHKS
jgi:hypothetical protein